MLKKTITSTYLIFVFGMAIMPALQGPDCENNCCGVKSDACSVVETPQQEGCDLFIKECDSIVIMPLAVASLTNYQHVENLTLIGSKPIAELAPTEFTIYPPVLRLLDDKSNPAYLTPLRI